MTKKEKAIMASLLEEMKNREQKEREEAGRLRAPANQAKREACLIATKAGEIWGEARKLLERAYP